MGFREGVYVAGGGKGGLYAWSCTTSCESVQGNEENDDTGEEFKLLGAANHGTAYVSKVDVYNDLIVSGDEEGTVRLYRLGEGIEFVSEFKVKGKVVECGFDGRGTLR